MGKAAAVQKEPGLTSQIASLNERKGGLQKGISNIKASILTHQKRLDDAEGVLVDAITTQMGDDTPETRDIVSEARVAKNVLMQQHDQHTYDLKLIPDAIKKLDTQLNALASEKKGLEQALIVEKLTDIDELKQKARESAADLAAYMCMTSTRNTNYVGVKEVMKQLDRDNSVSVLFIKKYQALEDSMGFDSL